MGCQLNFGQPIEAATFTYDNARIAHRIKGGRRDTVFDSLNGAHDAMMLAEDLSRFGIRKGFSHASMIIMYIKKCK